MRLKIVILALFILGLIGFLIYDGTADDDSFNFNNNLVSDLRKNETVNLNQFLAAVTVLVYAEFLMALYVVFFFLCSDKFFGFCVICHIVIGVYLNSILKLSYQKGRPYFFNSKIDVIGKCERGYGHPSGHAMIGLIAGFAFVDWLLHEYHLKNSQSSIYNVDYATVEGESIDTLNDVNLSIKAILIYVFTALVVLAIGISRVYLGAHSYEQVLSGYAWGLLYLVFYYSYFKTKFQVELRNVGHLKSIIGLEKIPTFFFITLLSVILFIVPIIVYEVNFHRSQDSYYASLIEKGCGSSNFKMLSAEGIIGSGLIGVVVGIFYGAFFSKGKAYYGKTRVLLKVSDQVIRLFVIVFIIGVAAAANQLLMMPQIVYLAYVLGSFLNFALAGFNYVFLMPLAFKLFKVTYNGDFMRM